MASANQIEENVVRTNQSTIKQDDSTYNQSLSSLQDINQSDGTVESTVQSSSTEEYLHSNIPSSHFGIHREKESVKQASSGSAGSRTDDVDDFNINDQYEGEGNKEIPGDERGGEEDILEQGTVDGITDDAQKYDDTEYVTQHDLGENFSGTDAQEEQDEQVKAGHLDELKDELVKSGHLDELKGAENENEAHKDQEEKELPEKPEEFGINKGQQDADVHGQDLREKEQVEEVDDGEGDEDEEIIDDDWMHQGQGQRQGPGEEQEEDQGVYSESDIRSETTSYPGISRDSVKEGEDASNGSKMEDEADVDEVRKKRSESRIQFKDVESQEREVTNVSRAKVNSPVSHTTEDRNQLENRILESRERTYRQAMNLMSARCTSVQTIPSYGPNIPSYGPNIPKYFYIHQKKPSPMPPLKAWRGYHGNVYFEPITINGIQENHHKNDQMSQTRSRCSTRNTIATRASLHRPATQQSVVLDRNVVMNRFSEHRYQDLLWLEGQESVGSLSLRPQTFCGRRQASSSHFDRIRKGSVARRIQEANRERRRPDIKVKGDKFLHPSIMSPLLLSTTQYSHSNQRAVMSSPDPYHNHHGYHDHFLPPVEQVRVSLRHVDNSREPYSRSSPYSRSAKMTEGFKPFIKYSPEIKAKYGRRLTTL